MSYRRIFLILAVAIMGLLPFRSPAPLYYTPGEGWYYLPYGTKPDWMRPRAQEQLQVAEKAFKAADYTIAERAAHRVLLVWPLSDYAPDAQYLLGRCYEVGGKDQAAFNAYQTVITKYPNSSHYEDVLWRQYAIGNHFLAGEWTKLWNIVPFFPSMDVTAEMFGQIVTNGPYSDVAPHAQLRIGAAREKQKDYEAAVKAYGVAADRYHDMPAIAADAIFRQGVAYFKEAARGGAEYDQSTAQQAIDIFGDFAQLYPQDRRVSQAQKAIILLKAQQVLGAYKIAQFYEDSKKWDGAAIYYNQVIQLDPNSPYAIPARQRIEALRSRLHLSED